MKYKKKIYCYLTMSNAIRKGVFSKEDENYKYLFERNCKSELEAIQSLLEYN